jgi:uncharacterized protein (DUF58 family)
MSFRTRLLIPAGLGMLLAVTGLLLRNEGVLALAVPFLIYTGILLYNTVSRCEANLRVERTLDTYRAEEGRSIHVNLVIENRGPAVAMFGATEVLPSEIAVTEGEAAALAPWPRTAHLEINYTIRAPRGVYVLPGMKVTSWDRFAIVPQRIFFSHTTTFYSLPRIERLEEIRIEPRHTRVYAGIVKANLGGSGLEFFGCREYAPGDNVRWINWRAYARRGRVIVNEYEQERIADITVILDARESVNAHVGTKQTFDYAARAAATTAVHFLQTGNRVGLLIYGDYLDWTYHGYGHLQKERILEALAKAKPAKKAIFEDLRYIPTRLFPPRSQLIIITPLASEDDVEVLGDLYARGYQIILLSPNSLKLEQSTLGLSQYVRLGVRMLSLKRELLLSTLRHTGMGVVDWDIAEPLAAPISWILSLKGRRFP